jgi:hypothetical protein
MDSNSIVAGRAEIPADRGNEPSGIHRATWAGMPLPALVISFAVKRVRIEIVFAVARKSG